MRIHLMKSGVSIKGCGSFPIRDEAFTPVLIDKGGSLIVGLSEKPSSFDFKVTGDLEFVSIDHHSMITVKATSEDEKSSGVITLDFDGRTYEVRVFAGAWMTEQQPTHKVRIGGTADGYMISAPSLGGEALAM